MKYLWASWHTRSSGLHLRSGKISEFKSGHLAAYGGTATFSLTHIAWSAAEITYMFNRFHNVSISQG